MTTRTRILKSVFAILTAFAFGRYSVHNPDVKTVETVDTTSNTKVDKDTHKVTTITKDPDGKEITTITEDTTSKIDKNTNSNTKIDQTITAAKQPKINISVLGANDFSRGLLVPTYGLSFNKEFIGPVTIGAFGLMNGVIGVSIGLDF